jgi:hypothetical protein
MLRIKNNKRIIYYTKKTKCWKIHVLAPKLKTGLVGRAGEKERQKRRAVRYVD